MIFYDTETCGFHGVCVLIQWTEDDGDVHLHSVWTSPIIETIKLIEKIMTHKDGVVGFNLAFDHFHLTKIYNMLTAYGNMDAYPVDAIDELAMIEPAARDGVCLKPVKALDLMLHARKGPYQSTMDRSPIRVKKVPRALAYELCDELNHRIKLRDIYFARNKNAQRWHVLPIKDKVTGEEDLDFVDIILKFNPSSALKALAVDIGLVDEYKVKKLDEVGVSDRLNPIEYGYAPFALAGVWDKKQKKVLPVGPGKWRGTWPSVVNEHIIHWGYNSVAREYARDDVIYTRGLYKHFGEPELGDDDSELACMVGAVRWKGFKLDIEAIKSLRTKMIEKSSKFTFINSPDKVLQYITEPMDDLEKMLVTDTRAVTLETIANMDGHSAQERCKAILEGRRAGKEVELYDKLLHAGRFHASFKVIGTLSTRMSGADKLNPQGIKRTKEVRSCFPFAFDGEELGGGDFDAFEVSLADAEYNDIVLHEALQNGKKFHALFGVEVFTDMTYDEIIASKNKENDKYTKSKNAVFAMFYGGEAYTLKTRLGVDMETAEAAYQSITKKYRGIGRARSAISKIFNTVKQQGGIGTKIEWHEPAEYIESMFGFRRYFTLENKICKALFDLAQDPPKRWLTMDLNVNRRDRKQTVGGAVQSALYAAVFSLQASNTRAALNHRIQSSGAQVTKHLERRLWDLQPCGIHSWFIRPFNVHDEVLAAHKPELREKIEAIVKAVLDKYRPRVPLIKMEWHSGLESWANK